MKKRAAKAKRRSARAKPGAAKGKKRPARSKSRSARPRAKPARGKSKAAGGKTKAMKGRVAKRRRLSPRAQEGEAVGRITPLHDERIRHHESSPALSAGDVDADWADAEGSGE